MPSFDAKMSSMRTTIRIDEALYRRAKARAAQTGRTVSEVIEDAVREALRPAKRSAGDVPALVTFDGGGVMPGVDLSSNAALLDAMEQDAATDALH